MSKGNDPEQITHPLDVARRAALIGGVAAVPGTAIGAFYGTLRTRTPVLFSLVSGAQCFAIGTTFWGARSSVLNRTGLLNWWNITRGRPTYPRDDLSPSLDERVRASTIAGVFTGFSLGLLFRGPRNVIPGTIMFSLFGWGGQHGYEYLDARRSGKLRKQADLKATGGIEEPKEPWMARLAKSKWSPLSILSDEEYIKMQEEKVLMLEAEIALVDERIAEFKKKAAEIEAKRLLQAAQEQAAKKQ